MERKVGEVFNDGSVKIQTIEGIGCAGCCYWGKCNEYLFKNIIGYCSQYDRKDNKPVTYRLHRILAEAWLDNPDNLPFVKHKNDNKSDNSVDNLAWGANPDNVKEGYDNGCYKFFTRSYKIKAVRKTDKIEFTFDSIRSAALALSMDRKAISAILKNLKNNNSLFEFYYI